VTFALTKFEQDKPFISAAQQGVLASRHKSMFRDVGTSLRG